MSVPTHAYFDWSGTLALSGSKLRFLAAGSASERLEMLKPGAVECLRSLHAAGVCVGIVSNSSHSGVDFRRALDDCGLLRWLRGSVVVSSDAGMERKPSTRMLQHAMAQDAAAEAARVVMIGDNFHNDVVPAAALGVRSVWLGASGGGSTEDLAAVARRLLAGDHGARHTAEPEHKHAHHAHHCSHERSAAHHPLVQWSAFVPPPRAGGQDS